MKKLILIWSIIILLLSLTSCSTDSVTETQTTEETGFIPVRYRGNWELGYNPPTPKFAEIKANKLYFQGNNENILKTTGTVTEDNGTTLCRINFDNNEKVLLLFSIYNPNDAGDDVISISYYRDGVLVHNGFWVRN